MTPFLVQESRQSASIKDDSSSLSSALFWVQGLYYLVTGVWPLVSIETFQMVTGPKTDHLVTGRQLDHWLVMTVGVLITCIALALLTAAWRRRISAEMVILAVASAIGLTGIDVLYVLRQVIAPIYLVDAALEILILATWAYLLARPLWARRAGPV
ncbi:MAG TPA: hypothetical protein VH592_15990 [Gemmataceae bacterium]|jgi:hypothetical protein